MNNMFLNGFVNHMSLLFLGDVTKMMALEAHLISLLLIANMTLTEKQFLQGETYKLVVIYPFDKPEGYP